MVGGSDFNILKRGCRHSRKLRCRSTGGPEMVRTTGFHHLPDDILMEILIRIPAIDIVDSTKFVCRKWREITRTRDFAYAHLHRLTPGLLFQNHDRLRMPTFMSVTQEGKQVQISDFIHRSRYGYFWTSCNGLILEPNINNGHELMITNPVTKHRFDLPPFTASTIHPNYSSVIGYVATRKEYKVVRTYYPVGDYSRVYCAILTVGVDNSWRLVDTHHLSPEASVKLNCYMLVTEGFVHWVQNYYSNHILSLNMETEVLSQIPAPRCNDHYYYHYCYNYLSAGSSVSLLIEVCRLKWEVWEMKPETGEWTKLPGIDLEAHKALLNEYAEFVESCILSPSGWLKYPEVIAFVAVKTSPRSRSLSLHVVYNVETKDVSLYETDYCSRLPLLHRNSLVRIC